jgi:hypothetical protein
MFKRLLFVAALCLPSFLLCQVTEDTKQAFLNRDQFLFAVKHDKNVDGAVPFEDHALNQIFIKVSIDGSEYNFLFDTGAITIVSDEILQKLQLKESFSNNLIDAGGSVQKEKFYQLEGLSIGTTLFKNISVASKDLSSLSTNLCVKLDGLLGSNIIRTLNWKIDYKNSTLSFRTGSFKPGVKSDRIAFEENFSGSPQLKLVMGEYNFPALLDLGNNQEINLPDSLFFKSYKRMSHMLKKGRGNNYFTLYKREAYTVHAGVLDSIYFADKLYKAQVMRIEPSPLPLVGNKFFKRFGEFIIDYDRHEVYIPKTPVDTERSEMTFGFTPLLTDGKLIISFVWQGSDAERNGLETGSIIKEINGKNTENLKQEEWCTLRSELMGFDTLSLSVVTPGGKQVKIQVKKYNLFAN